MYYPYFVLPISLCSAFYWLVTLFIITSLFRGFAPLHPTIGPYVGLILVAVLIQEAARLVLWRFHRISLRALEYVAGLREHAGASLTVTDHYSLSLTHGLAHSIVHTLFFCVSWLPLALGDGTIYAETCPSMNFYLVSTLTTLAFAGVLTGGMILGFAGLEKGDYKQAAAVSAVHLTAALLTLVNFTQGGCLISVPLLLIGGSAMGAWAGGVWWRHTGQVLRQRPRNGIQSGSRSPSTRPQHAQQD